MDIVKYLLLHPDTDVHVKDNDGLTALAVAMEAGHRDVGVVLYASTSASRGSSPYSSMRSRRPPSSASRASTPPSSEKAAARTTPALKSPIGPTPPLRTRRKSVDKWDTVLKLCFHFCHLWSSSCPPLKAVFSHPWIWSCVLRSMDVKASLWHSQIGSCVMTSTVLNTVFWHPNSLYLWILKQCFDVRGFQAVFWHLWIWRSTFTSMDIEAVFFLLMELSHPVKVSKNTVQWKGHY